MVQHFDLVVIGGGSGGSACAKRAAGYGKKVCLIERGVSRDEKGTRQGAGVGGTCVNVGCVPKKLMFNAAAHVEMVKGPAATAAGYGVNVEKVTLDWPGLKKRRDAEIKRLNGVYETGWKKAGVEVILGFATFKENQSSKDVKTINIALAEGGGEISVTADKVLIAVGGYPTVPNIPGKDLCITSDGFFDLEDLPRKTAVIGAGYIAVEMAGILNALGSDTTLLCRGDTVLRHGFDPFVSRMLCEQMAKHGPKLSPKSEPESVSKAADGTMTIKLKDGREVGGFDCVLAAIGRTPATAALNLDAAGIKTNQKGKIVVNEFEETSVDGICAIGDATTCGVELTPTAIAAGRRLADRLFGGEPRARMDYADIPTVVFSHPPIATCGLTEAAAKEKYGAENVKAREAKFNGMWYTFNDADHKVKTGIKLVLVGAEQRVAGLHMIGPATDEILQGFSVAIKMGATLADFESAVAIHPTTAEEIVTFGGWGQTNGKPRLSPVLNPPSKTPVGAVLLGVAVGAALGVAATFFLKK